MDEILYYSKYGSMILLVLTTIIKLWNCLFLLSNNQIASFFNSFIHWYEKHQIYETTSVNRKAFMQRSNITNLIWWPSFILVIIFYIVLKDVLPF